MSLLMSQQFGEEFLTLLLHLSVGQYFSDQRCRVDLYPIFNRSGWLYIGPWILIALILDVQLLPEGIATVHKWHQEHELNDARAQENAEFPL